MSMFKIHRNGKKYSIDTEFSFDDLVDALPIEVETAKEDMNKIYRELVFTVVDGDLYARHHTASDEQNYWYFFDTSTRHWSECDDPVTA